MKIKLIFFIIFVSINTCFGQQNNTDRQFDSLPNTVENLFIKTLGKAKNWKEYKLIKRTDFTMFKREILDSISNLKKSSSDKITKIQTLNSQIENLNTKIKELDTELKEYKTTDNEEKRIKSIILGIIITLSIALLYFIYRFKNSNTLTKAAQQKFDELELEFDTHRKKTLENEQKLRRKLQDEINKQRGV